MYKIFIILVIVAFNLVRIDAQESRMISSLEVDSLKTIRLASPDRAIRYARQLLITLNPDQKKIESRILNILGEIYIDLHLPSIALQCFIESGQKSISRQSPWNKINIGNVYFQQGQWLEAKERYLQALDIFRRRPPDRDNVVSGKSVALSNLGRIERNLKNYDDALVFFKEALGVKRGQARYKAFQRSLTGETIDYPSSGKGVAYQHSLMAELYYAWNLNDMALEQLKASDSLLSYVMLAPNFKESQSCRSDLGKNHLLRMNIFSSIENYAGAHVESKSAISLLKHSPILMARYHNAVASIQIKQDSLYSALGSLDKALKTCELNGLSMFELSLLEKKIELMQSNNLEKSALGIAEILIKKKDLISSKRMELLLESLNYKSELDINRKKLEDAQSRELIFYVFAGLSLIIIGMVLIGLRNKRRAETQKALIHEQERQIAENELSNKQDELIKLSAHIVSKNDLLGSIEKDLEYYTSLIESKSDKRVMEPLKKVIQNKIDDSSDWEQFQNQFSAAYPKFVESLSNGYPDLRTADIKLCCYLKMSMNTKEVAKVTGLSVRAVENKRYRLRKKLNLNTEISLDSFIHAFGGEIE